MPRLAALPSPHLTLLQGGRSHARHDELHLEIVAAKAERLVLAGHLRAQLRLAMRLLAAGHLAAVGTALVEMLRLSEQDAMRAQAMDTRPCGCDEQGPGHGEGA